ncbi:MAG TPA: hypothetical protein VKB18_10075 [Gemmatimonadota bacterium]|nr:hypothetical protein [Gemmatimonadota bacterium]
MRRNLLLLALAAAAVAALVVLGPILSAPEPVPEPASLHPWRLVGCWKLRYGAWGGVDVPAGQRAPGDEGAPTGALAPPRTLMLVPDSVDAWGRTLPSYRAVAAGADTGRAHRSLRWLVRRDTLWVLWTEEGARAGAALRPSGDSLVGSVRATERTADGRGRDLSARAAAVPVSCATGEREREPARPRR